MVTDLGLLRCKCDSLLQQQQAALVLAEQSYKRFADLELVQPFEESLAEKQQRMDTALAAFEGLVGYAVSDVTAAATFYIAEIYFDFSGYSDIARGLAKWMGLHFKLNFNHPYHARSLREFWTRWHISLSTWFRDYVYIPLGGGKGGVICDPHDLSSR